MQNPNPKCLGLLLGALLLGACGQGDGSTETPSPTATPTPAFLHETEGYPGGETTVLYYTPEKAYAYPAPNLTGERKLDFFPGNTYFNDPWVTAPASTSARDGLGPVFNANSCSACHLFDGRGAPPTEEDEPFLGLLLRLSVPGPDGESLPDPIYGGQFQHRAISNVPSEGEATVRWIEEPGTLDDGTPYSLRRPVYEFPVLNFGPMADDVEVSPRVATGVYGLGLLQALEAETLLALADENDEDGDGISGRPNYVWDIRAQDYSLGRFGWKSNQPTIEQQSAGAFLGDIGITSSLFPHQNCTDLQVDCQNAYPGGDPELEDDQLFFVTYYSHLLAVPARRDWDSASVIRGKRIFQDAGCAKCHIETLETGDLADYPEVSNQVIHPYTDLLLHDMGEGLSDGRPDGLAGPQEWRTAPLWGIGLLETVNDHQFLMHDGRARGFEEAILWHGGEAEASRDHYAGLSAEERDDLMDFLYSL